MCLNWGPRIEVSLSEVSLNRAPQVLSEVSSGWGVFKRGSGNRFGLGPGMKPKRANWDPVPHPETGPSPPRGATMDPQGGCCLASLFCLREEWERCSSSDHAGAGGFLSSTLFCLCYSSRCYGCVLFPIFKLRLWNHFPSLFCMVCFPTFPIIIWFFRFFRFPHLLLLWSCTSPYVGLESAVFNFFPLPVWDSDFLLLFFFFFFLWWW